MTTRFATVPFLVIVLALVAITLAAIGPHANFRHGREADIARVCGENPEYQFYHPQLGRWALVCYIPELSRWGITIVDQAGKEITSFVKNKMQYFEDVVRYLSNRGYEHMPPP